MKISILLPLKENFSPKYPGAVSLFINDTLKKSKYKNKTLVYGNTNFKEKFKLKYKNIEIKKSIFKSQNRSYAEEFIKLENGKFITETLVTHKNSTINIVKKEVPIT